MFDSMQRVQARLERACSAVAAAALFLMMLIVTLDVGLRYFAGKPLPWSYDFVSIYLTVLLFFLALSSTMREEGHIRLDLLQKYMRVRSLRLWEIVNSLLAACLFGLIAVLGGLQTRAQWLNSDVIASWTDWPTWLSTVFVPIGAGLMVARLLLTAGGHIATLWTGREFLPLPALPGDEDPIGNGE